MRPLVNVREDHARITPGEAFRAHVDVRNAGTIVETYDLIPLGPAAPWVEIEPSSLSLFPLARSCLRNLHLLCFLICTWICP